MNTIREMIFKRKFSVNLYKSKKLPLAEMSFSKDWINTDRGDTYPVISQCGDINEAIKDSMYTASANGSACIKRLLGQYFPYATYEIAADITSGAIAGISIDTKDGRNASVYMKRSEDTFRIYKCINGMEAAVTDELAYNSGTALVVTAHHGSMFDIYIRYGNHLSKLGYFEEEGFADLKNEKIFRSATASVYAGFENEGLITLSKAEMYLDCGISQADIRPVRYEDGCPMMEKGRIYLTVSSRLETEKFQTVFSWNPSACDFRLEGAIFFDAGDGEWWGDVAS